MFGGMKIWLIVVLNPVRNKKLLDFYKINKIGINCSGLINIIRKGVGLEIPWGKRKNTTWGGSYIWFRYLKKKKN